MGFFDNVKSFIHSISTDDHYASYDSPYKTSGVINNSNIIGNNNDGGIPSNGSNSRLHELNRLNNNNSSTNILIDNHIGYTPGMKSSSTEVQLQEFNNNGQPPLPSIDSLWDRIDHWIEEEYPEIDENLNDGATTADLNEFENDLGCGALPNDFRQFYKRHDGQFLGGKPTGLIMGLALLDLESLMEDYALWGKVAERLERQQYIAQQQLLQQQQQQQQQQLDAIDGDAEGSSSSSATANASASASAPISNSFIANQRSIPPNSVQPYYYHKGWLPILKDLGGNQIALDLAPGPAGKWGQIILFGRDFDTKLVIASSFQEFIFGYVNDLESGNYRIDSNDADEDLGFLSRTRDDDYMIGDEDENQGELTFYDRDGLEFGKGALRGNVGYIEVLKRRALKKYGLTENFSTAFTPKHIPTKRSNNTITSDSSNTPNRSQSPILKADAPIPASVKAPSPLINVETASSSANVTIHKETLIDDKIDTKPKTEESKAEESKVEEKESVKEVEPVQESVEEVEEVEETTPLKEAIEDENVDQVVDGLKEVEL
ncbi:protein involved in-beta-glucan synthesis [Scheffersomyces amazonensis]|uniref:protein involved in-beta-glucan synthesis n=1 Tax=Scheffersomyces amazonensis TaxID=1078765 RepID=UPI00315CE969